MRAPSRNIKPNLSAHAVIRYVQRALDVVVGVDEMQFGSTFCMHLHLYAAGITFEQVERAVLTPLVSDAIRAGATSIPMPFGRLEIGEHGTVKTVLAHRFREPHPHTKARKKPRASHSPNNAQKGRHFHRGRVWQL